MSTCSFSDFNPLQQSPLPVLAFNVGTGWKKLIPAPKEQGVSGGGAWSEITVPGSSPLVPVVVLYEGMTMFFCWSQRALKNLCLWWRADVKSRRRFFSASSLKSDLETPEVSGSLCALRQVPLKKGQIMAVISGSTRTPFYQPRRADFLSSVRETCRPGRRLGSQPVIRSCHRSLTPCPLLSLAETAKL